MNIGQTIKKLRLKKDISIETFAKNTNIPIKTLKLIEKEKHPLNEDTIERIATALNIPTPFITFYAIETIDVPEDKKEVYELLHPHIKALLNEILFPKYIKKC